MVHNAVKHDARVLKAAASMKARGHDVRVFGLAAEDSEDFMLPNGVPVHLEHRDVSDARARIAREGLPPGRKNSILMSFRIQGETLFESVKATFEPDVVHLHDHLALSAAAKYKAAFRCALIWDAHEIYEDLARIEEARAAVNSQIIGENAPYVDGFVTLNESIASFYREKYPALPEAVLIPNAVERVELERYDGRLHARAGLVPDQKILLFQGGYSPHRGIPALLEASRLLHDDWSLVFMGWGKLEAEIREHADEKSDRPVGRARVVTVPAVTHDELLKWTAGASLGAIPYENTGLNHLYCSPNKLWEYPAAGVPVLASDMPEMRKKIESYGVGITVGRELDPAAIAAVVNALSDTELQEMRERCSQFAEAEQWEHYEERLVDLYSRLGRELVSETSSLAGAWRNFVRLFRG